MDRRDSLFGKQKMRQEKSDAFWQSILIIKTEQTISFFFLPFSLSLISHQEAPDLLTICILPYCMAKKIKR